MTSFERLGWAAALALIGGCGSSVSIPSARDEAGGAPSVPTTGGGGGTSSGEGGGGAGGSLPPPPPLCAVGLTGLPSSVVDGDELSDPATVALTWSRQDGTRVTALSYLANDLPPPPGFDTTVVHVSFEPWGAWPPGPSPQKHLQIGANGLRAIASANDTFAAAGAGYVPNSGAFGLGYHGHVDPDDSTSPLPTSIAANGQYLVRALAGRDTRHLVLSVQTGNARVDVLDAEIDPPTSVASHLVGCSGAPAHGDAIRDGDAWWIAVGTAASGCDQPPTALLLGRLDDEASLVTGPTLQRPGGFGQVRLVHHDGARWLLFTGEGLGSAKRLHAAPLLDDLTLGSEVQLADDVDPEVELVATPFATGVAIAYHSVDQGIVARLLSDLSSGETSSLVDLPDPGPHHDTLSVVPSADGTQLLVGWAAVVPVPPSNDPKPRAFVARLGCE